MPNTANSTNHHPVLVIGSGAGGGMAAYALTQAGIDVLLLEAGRDYNPVTEAAMFNLPKDAPLRGIGTPDKPNGFYDAIPGNDVGEPYTVAEGSEFYWDRARILGGRTSHWGRVVPRYGPDDFKPLSHTGYGTDWPLSYTDIEPYYDRVEALIGVNGSSDAIPNSPSPNPATCQPPPAPRGYELLFMKACKALGRPLIATPSAILTEPKGSRSACFYATKSSRGCSIDAAFQSPTGFIKPALQTGHLTLITEAMVHRILTDKKGEATGAEYIDKPSGERKTVTADYVVLAASAMASCRILLNSKNSTCPEGLANSSGLVGRHITDTPVCSWTVQLPVLENLPPHNEDGTSEPHIESPWPVPNNKKKTAAFFGGYKIVAMGGGRLNPPGMYTMWPYLGLKKGLYGSALKQHLRHHYGSIVSLVTFGGMAPNKDCYCELDPEVKDRWGIPVLKFHWQWSEEDLDQAAHMHRSVKAIARQMNGQIINDPSPADGRKVHSRGGSCSHEVGGAIMGASPKTSVLNPYSQSWDVPNLYITDGASFTTHAEKNPTLTIMALAWRATDHLIKRIKGAGK